MIGRNDNHIECAREISAILIRGATGSGGKAAAMAVNHDGPLPPVGRGSPDVEKKAILSRRGFATGGAPARLQGRRAEFQCIAYTGPALERRRGLEAVRSGNRTGVGDALECCHAGAFFSANTPVCRFDLDELRFFRQRERALRQRGCADYGHRALGKPAAPCRPWPRAIGRCAIKP